MKLISTNVIISSNILKEYTVTTFAQQRAASHFCNMGVNLTRQFLIIYIIVVFLFKVSKFIWMSLLLPATLEMAKLLSLLKTFIALASYNVYQFNTVDENQGLIHVGLLQKCFWKRPNS